LWFFGSIRTGNPGLSRRRPNPTSFVADRSPACRRDDEERRRNGSAGRAQVVPQKFLLAYPDALAKSWPWIEAASDQAIVGWLLDMLASLKEQGVFRAWKTSASEESDRSLPLANHGGIA
jgi:hypothetical protein